jgi:hypothetical protein
LASDREAAREPRRWPLPSKRGLSAEQIPVIVARDRTGATTDAVLPRLDAASFTAALGQVITRQRNGAAYHGRLKEWMRRFHGVAIKNLP